MKILTREEILKDIGITGNKRVAMDGWTDSVNVHIKDSPQDATYGDTWEYEVGLRFTVNTVVSTAIHHDPGVYEAVMRQSATSINRELYDGIATELLKLSHRIARGELDRDGAARAVSGLAESLLR